MSQLLLVDDEPMIVGSMVANDWASIGIEGVHKAGSGLEAIGILASTPIDIVVTDIRMPGMDGLQLCKHIQEHYPRTKCILLSGYGEFEYARKAIAYGTANYLLKPVKDEELMDEVGRLRELLEREWEEMDSVQRARHTLRVHLPMLRANLLNDLLSGIRLPNGLLAERMNEYGLSISTGRHASMLMVRIDESESAIPDPSLLEYAVRNIASEILEAEFEVWGTKDSFGYLCYLLQGKADGTWDKDAALRLENIAGQLVAKVGRFLRGTVTALVGEPRLFPLEIVDQYRKSLNGFRKVPRSEQGIVILERDSRSQYRSLDSLYAPPGFQGLFEAGRWQDARSKLAELEKEMREKKLDTEEHVTEVAYALMNAFLYTAHLQGKTLLELTGFEADILSEQGLFTRLDGVMEWADMALRSLETANVKEVKDGKGTLIPNIHRFIESRIAGDVSLQAIADHVGLHPAYLSSLYKQETKENISDFIMRYRMEKASVLLRTTDIRIYELSGQLGFQNPPYFSKLFKYYYGVTPQDYRERNGK
ncbi:DNA-binding response regulator [Paenibacillus agaridevorans]|uniref:DNA-binding response regulator n=1 Tax=Paenibacillus agaridevorans TaxID=171404 RepID=A0A2R5EKD9_9BACL|nr:response regulator [Paenibacillus agaridevorans]GBG06575.1 DNA-binding response regulator [Paenibacillus agaridevorans]